MKIWYLMIEAVPNDDNEESKICRGAYVNFWVKAETIREAVKKAKQYIDEENWSFMRTMDSSVAQRESCAHDPDSLEGYDEACEFGIAAAFYTWETDE